MQRDGDRDVVADVQVDAAGAVRDRGAAASSPSIAMSSAPVRSRGTVSENDVSNVIGAADGVVGNRRAAPSPAFDTSARS